MIIVARRTTPAAIPMKLIRGVGSVRIGGVEAVDDEYALRRLAGPAGTRMRTA
jgi:hypothetical protein